MTEQEFLDCAKKVLKVSEVKFDVAKQLYEAHKENNSFALTEIGIAAIELKAGADFYDRLEKLVLTGSMNDVDDEDVAVFDIFKDI